MLTPEAQIRNAVENCELMIEEAILRLGTEEDESERRYLQGKKDACRVILLSFDPQHQMRTSEDVL
jgi:uncharacterized protein YheU (UPF0270 family)